MNKKIVFTIPWKKGGCSTPDKDCEREMEEKHYKKRKGQRNMTGKRKGYDQATALGPVII